MTTRCSWLEYVPAQPIRDILEHAYQTGWARREIAGYTGVHERIQYRIMASTRPAATWRRAHRSSDVPVLTKYGWCIPRLEEVTFNVADRLVICLSCWHSNPDLAAIYENAA